MNQNPMPSIPPFHIMAKPCGPICNLACDYCFYLPKESIYPGSSFRMTDKILESFIRQYIESQLTPVINFTWQGGEPTMMGLDFFHLVVALQRKYARPGQRIENALQTNGTLLNEMWCRFFAEHHFLIGVSLDGPHEMHDFYRKYKNGAPSFDCVTQSILLLKQFGVDFNILSCISTANVQYPLDVYRFLRDDIGAEYLQFIPIVKREHAGSLREGPVLPVSSITAEQYGSFLIEIFDEWIRRDVGKVFVQMFDSTLARWFGAPGGVCVFGETCALALALEHNGDVYSCDHFVDSDHWLGNIEETPLSSLVNSLQQRQFVIRKQATLPHDCQQCSVLFACNGGCPKDRLDLTPDGEPGLNHLCAGYKAFFTHVEKLMNLMVNLLRQRRPASEVMALLRKSNN